MNFGEKVRELRIKKGMTQEQLAKELGMTRRTVISYEQEGKYPRHREVYDRLADILGANVTELRSDVEEFMTGVGEKYGSRGQKQAAALKEQFAALLAGGELSSEEQDAFLLDMQQIFYDAKREAQRKYTPKKFRSDNKSND